MDVMSSMAVFRRVVEAKNFSAVARETNMSQSTVSKHIAALEERLGTITAFVSLMIFRKPRPASARAR